jgi:ATP-dependent Clp protease ATP-binding subunit ClpA
MTEKNIALTWDESVIDHLVKEAYSVTYGARNLRRTIQKQIEDVIAQRIVSARGQSVHLIRLSAEDGKVAVNIE